MKLPKDRYELGLWLATIFTVILLLPVLIVFLQIPWPEFLFLLWLISLHVLVLAILVLVIEIARRESVHRAMSLGWVFLFVLIFVLLVDAAHVFRAG